MALRYGPDQVVLRALSALAMKEPPVHSAAKSRGLSIRERPRHPQRCALPVSVRLVMPE